MKQLKSSSADLRQLYEESITVKYVAEPLKAVTLEDDALTIQQWMKEQDFDVVGIEENGIICAYLERNNLGKGLCKDYQKLFHPSELISSSTPLMQLLPLLRDKKRLFVLEYNRINSIVTYGDLQKAPVRMLLFSLITLLEMNLLKIVRNYFTCDNWQKNLRSERVEMARKLWELEREKNEALDLLDYLQFCDKRDLILTSPELCKKLGLTSKRGAERLFKSAEALRNRLAHAQDLVSGSSWPDIINLAGEIENLLQKCEEWEMRE
jgi:hypothetical protein